ncbi:23S rRNA (-N6)-methyltransferase [Blastomyces parvus]|uniref:23S rRNA (-N6)-methyltransferase n=1 Tax=Blastomyces parvus TaxID=2060905 RepID=A0A2B7WL93_9EURO|nr:23S rRNA (-N6)-methyltransferase [Blastomyces parvus]
MEIRGDSLTGDQDIDAKNLKYARDNVRRNKLDSRVQIVERSPSDPLIPLGEEIGMPESDTRLDFTMCNPPFYESRDELISAAKAKQRPPFSACTGAEVEMITAGGEVAFVNRMIKESVKLRDRVQWYTSMVGKFSSVATLLTILHEEGNKNWAVAEFVQGSKTRRWGIGWSWMDYRPRADAARPQGQSIPKHLLPFPPEFTFHSPPSTPLSTTIDAVNSTITALDVYWCWNSGTSTGLGFARGNAWSRHARRQMKKQAIEKAQTAATNAPAEHSEKDSKENDVKPADFIPEKQDKGAEFGFKVSVRGGMEGQVEVTVRWVNGFDAVIFESFCGFLKRKVEKGE